MKIKVLHCITDLSPDGAQRVLLRLVTGTNPEEFTHEVIALRPGGALQKEFEAAGIKVLDCKMQPGSPNPLGPLRLIRLIKESNPDIIQAWMYHANLLCTVACLLGRIKVPVLWNMRRCLEDPKKDKLSKRIVIALGAKVSRFATRIIYCVQRSAVQHEAIGYDSTNRVIITNGFDFARFAPRSDSRSRIRELINQPENAKVVGIVGRYHSQKDFPNFLRAVQIISKKRKDLQFVMIGHGLSSDNRELMSLISTLGVQNNIHLLDHREDVNELMSGFDLYCSSSENEGFANVIAEAMASGVPCVVTEVGASRELVEGLGIIVPRCDSQALANGIESMCALSSDELKRRGALGREKIITAHSLQLMIKKYEALYKDIVSAEIHDIKRAA